MEVESKAFLSIDDLPLDALEHILRFCDGYSYFASQVCSDWRQVVLPWGDLKEKFLDMCFEKGLPCVAKLPGSCFTIPRLQSLVKIENVDLLRVANQRANYIFICQDLAAEHGSLKVLQWYKKEIGKIFSCRVGRVAASRGHWNVVDWLIEKGFYLDDEVIAGAAEFGSLEVILKLKANGCPWAKNVCESAAVKGHLHILQYLRSNPENLCHWDEKTSCKAAEGGNLEVLKWLKEQDCPWDPQIPTILAMKGHFEALRWEMENGGQWNVKIFNWIAGNGDLEVLKWAWENKCPYDNSFTSSAAFSGHLHILKWAVHEGFSLAPNCIDSAFQGGGHFETLRWLRKQGHPWPKKTEFFLLKMDKKVRHWAVENGCPDSYFRTGFIPEIMGN